ncbi:hypothetical protein [Streptomyces sp. NPDC046942]
MHEQEPAEPAGIARLGKLAPARPEPEPVPDMTYPRVCSVVDL